MSVWKKTLDQLQAALKSNFTNVDLPKVISTLSSTLKDHDSSVSSADYEERGQVCALLSRVATKHFSKNEDVILSLLSLISALARRSRVAFNGRDVDTIASFCVTALREPAAKTNRNFLLAALSTLGHTVYDNCSNCSQDTIDRIVSESSTWLSRCSDWGAKRRAINALWGLTLNLPTSTSSSGGVSGLPPKGPQTQEKVKKHYPTIASFCLSQLHECVVAFEPPSRTPHHDWPAVIQHCRCVLRCLQQLIQDAKSNPITPVNLPSLVPSLRFFSFFGSPFHPMGIPADIPIVGETPPGSPSKSSSGGSNSAPTTISAIPAIQSTTPTTATRPRKGSKSGGSGSGGAARSLQFGAVAGGSSTVAPPTLLSPILTPLAPTPTSDSSDSESGGGGSGVGGGAGGQSNDSGVSPWDRETSMLRQFALSTLTLLARVLTPTSLRQFWTGPNALLPSNDPAAPSTSKGHAAHPPVSSTLPTLCDLVLSDPSDAVRSQALSCLTSLLDGSKMYFNQMIVGDSASEISAAPRSTSASAPTSAPSARSSTFTPLSQTVRSTVLSLHRLANDLLLRSPRASPLVPPSFCLKFAAMLIDVTPYQKLPHLQSDFLIPLLENYLMPKLLVTSPASGIGAGWSSAPPTPGSGDSPKMSSRHSYVQTVLAPMLQALCSVISTGLPRVVDSFHRFWPDLRDKVIVPNLAQQPGGGSRQGTPQSSPRKPFPSSGEPPVAPDLIKIHTLNLLFDYTKLFSNGASEGDEPAPQPETQPQHGSESSSSTQNPKPSLAILTEIVDIVIAKGNNLPLSDSSHSVRVLGLNILSNTTKTVWDKICAIGQQHQQPSPPREIRSTPVPVPHLTIIDQSSAAGLYVITPSLKAGVLSSVLGSLEDEHHLVRNAACRVCGSFLGGVVDVEKECLFVVDCVSRLSELACGGSGEGVPDPKAFREPNVNVRLRAMWALANLAGEIIKSPSLDPVTCQDLARALIRGTMDNDKVACNAVRGVGNCLLWKFENFVESPTEFLGTFRAQASASILRCMTNGSVKTRWNACYAAGNLLQTATESAVVDPAITAELGSILAKDANLKAKVQAAKALSFIPIGVGEIKNHLGQSEAAAAVLACVLEAFVNLPAPSSFEEYRYMPTLTKQIRATAFEILKKLLLAQQEGQPLPSAVVRESVLDNTAIILHLAKDCLTNHEKDLVETAQRVLAAMETLASETNPDLVPSVQKMLQTLSEDEQNATACEEKYM